MKSLAYGEVLWDIVDENAYIGGATFNVGAHLAKFGCESLMLTCLGNDDYGNKAIEKMKSFGMSVDFVQRSEENETGKALVMLDEANTASYDIPISAFDYIQVDDSTITKLKSENIDVLIYGTIASRIEGGLTQNSLKKILSEMSFDQRFFDINIRQNFYSKNLIELCMQHASIMKVNDEESPLVSEIFYSSSLSDDGLADALRKDFGIEVLIITKGSEGCSVYDKNGRADLPGHKVKVVDSIGAGDSFSATFLYNYLGGKNAAESARLGNIMGSYVASQSGGVPNYSQELKHELGIKN